MRRWIGCGGLALTLTGLAIALPGWGVATYQALLRKEIAVERDWSHVENAYQRRLDLVPNLLETIGGVAGETSGAVMEARSKISRMIVTQEILDDRPRFQSLERAQAELSDALSRLLAQVAKRPRLERSEDYLALRTQLTSTEGRIAAERGSFNASVRHYNAALRAFPARLIADVLGFGPKPSFEEPP